jgi:hypothetical protein
VREFRTFRPVKRVPAERLRPVVDPADWSPAGLGPVEGWSYRLTERDHDELDAAIAAVRRNHVPTVDVSRENFPLGHFAAVLGDVHRELTDGRGMVMLRNFPVGRFDREAQAIGYLGLGAYLGQRMTQNRDGHVLGHVKDLGGDYADPKTRGYLTRAEMLFHSDGCDYVGLLCLTGARSGGESRVASSVAVYNMMLKHRPDLVAVLCEDFYRSRAAEVGPGQQPWYRQPIFSFVDGYFSATGAGIAIDKAHSLPGVPPLTAAQQEAIEVYRATVAACAVDIDFAPGDIQFLNNFVTLHTRRAYQDWPDPARKRHLLRLWLADPAGRPIPPEQRAGRAGSGIKIQGLKLVAPLDVEAAAV